MGMIQDHSKTTDPRDSLSKARRTELVKFSRAQGFKNIDPNMPAELIRHLLRQNGVRSIPIPQRLLGQPNQPHANAPLHASNVSPPQTNGVEVSAMVDLARQFAQEQRTAPAADEAKPLKDMGINELRARGKELGIKFERTDNIPKMRDKIEAKLNNG